MKYDFQKVSRVVLASSLVLSQFSAVAIATTSHSVYAQTLASKSVSMLSNVSNETAESYDKDDQVTVIVKLKEDKALDPTILSTQEGKDQRISETKTKRDQVVKSLKQQGLEFDTLLEYDLLFNGFSANTNYETAQKIAKATGVESVEMNVTYSKPEVSSLSLINRGTESTQSLDSNAVMNVAPVWESGYKGEGMIVAVIDSGLDPTHDVFQLTDVSKAKYTNESEMNAKKQEVGINYGKWYSNKIVFAYNYNDQNDVIKEATKDSHGTHVAGISVGNPSKEIATGEKVVGVAPEAQLMFMRVFSDVQSPGSTSSYIYAKAVEDAVKLGADSINLSLGSATGNVQEVGPAISQAIATAKAAGITVAIAAGNDNSFGDTYDKPNATSPDYGLVGEPSVVSDSISVAAVNNQTIISQAVTVVDTSTGQKRALQISTPNHAFPMGELVYIEAGIGEKSDFENKDVQGKVALIKRGKIAFSEKATNAHEAGAIGVIVYNHEEGGEETLGMNLSDAPSKFPVTSVGFSDGQYLSQNADKFKVLFDGSLLKQTHQQKNELTDFTSWGVSSDGQLKPDLTAPGGDIYSSINDGEYANMDGTSMASPHVAGAIALVKQSLAKRYPNLKGASLQNLIKLLLMSTATPHFNEKEQSYTSPRQQGAGIVNTMKATTSDFYVTNVKNGYGSVSLGNINEDFNFVVEVHNLSAQSKEFRYVTEVVTDKVDENGKFALAPRSVVSIPGGTVTVPANGSVKVPINVKTAAYTEQLSEVMPNGYFLDGFVRFVDPIDDVEAVSIPFTGFKGSFENLAVLEKPIYEFDLSKEKPFYYLDKNTGAMDAAKHFTYLKTQEVAADVNHYGTYQTTENKILGEFKNYTTGENYFDTSKIAISPNGDNSYDFVQLNTVFLRNYEKFQVVVKNAQGERVFGGPISSGVKNFYAGRRPKSQVALGSTWDGKDSNGNNLPDGQYTYEVTYRAETPGSKDQKISYPIYLDRVAPEFTGGVYDAATRTYTPNKIKEEGSGLQYVALRTLDIQLDDKGDIVVDSKGEPKMKAVDVLPNEDGTFTIPEGMNYDDYDIYAVDWAGNENDSTMKIQVNDLGQFGQVDVHFSVEGYDSDLKSYISRYVIRNSKGEVVTNKTRQRPVGIDALGDVIMRTVHLLPIGDTYTVELVLVDTDAVTMLTPMTATVDLTRDNASQVVTFKAREKYINTLTVEFDEVLPEGSKVVVVDKDGKAVELSKNDYASTIYEKRFENGEYTITVELPNGYAVDKNNVVYQMVNGTNVVKFDVDKVVDKAALEALITEVDKIDLTDKTAQTSNVLKTVLQSAKAVLTNNKATSEDVATAIEQLTNAKNGLKVKESFTGLVQHTDKNWYYVKDSGIDWTFTGVVKHTDGKSYYVRNGRVDFDATGLVPDVNGELVYVKKGMFDETFTGLVQHTDKNWYSVRNGRVDRSVAPKPDDAVTKVYRLYDKATKLHFYTIHLSEVRLLQSRGWVFEGVAWINSSDRNGIPVYRVWNKQTGERIFTRSKSELDKLVSRGLINEGVAFRTQNSGHAIYRLVNKKTKRYVLTADKSEVDKLVNSGQWINEGIAFFALSR